MPKVSVVLPVHNGLPYLAEAIQSIIDQTLTDWELLVINDRSTDGSERLAAEYAAKDGRIKLLNNDTDEHGPGKTRNIGFDAAAGEYIALIDADDISLPNRLEEQVKFMDKHQDVAMSGCWIKMFGKKKVIHPYFTSDYMIKTLLFFHSEFWGPTIIFRRNTIKERYPNLSSAEDTYFCIEVCIKHRVANLAKVLYHYRVQGTSITAKIKRVPNYKRVMQDIFPLHVGFTPTDEQMDAHLAWLGDVEGVSFTRQFKWLVYVLRHGKYKWHQRCIIAVWWFARAILKKIYHVIFGTRIAGHG